MKMDLELFQGFKKEVFLFSYDVTLCMNHPQHTHTRKNISFKTNLEAYMCPA